MSKGSTISSRRTAGIDDAGKKRAALLAGVGATTYRLLRSLVSPDKPGDKTYAEIVAVLKAHFNPTPTESVQRERFYSRIRKPDETVAAFVSELRSIAEFCNFGANLEEMLKDRIVCGINNRRIQQRLFTEKDLTYKKAVKLAQSLETAAKNVQELTGSQGADVSGAGVVHRVVPPKDAKRSFTGNCFCCGRAGHTRANCSLKDATCRGCGKKGHLVKVCRSKPSGRGKSRPHDRKNVHHVDNGSEDEYDLYTITSSPKPQPYKTTFTINGKAVAMEIDTGASLTLMSEHTFRKYWPDLSLSRSGITLHTYSGESIPVSGTVDVCVKYCDQEVTLPLLVVEGEGPSLLGRNWLCKLKLDWHAIFWLHNASLNQVLEKHESVFKPGLGKVSGFEAKILIDPNAQPRYFKARSIPYFYRDKVERELERLVQEGTLEPVEHSKWAAPIVAVLKRDKQNVRICGDFKQTVNPVAKLDRYPIPRIEDLFAKLSGGKSFSKLDLSQAYLQVPLDEASKHLVVVNTHKGLFRYTRLPYGVSSAPGIFQRLMENVLRGIPNVIVYLDDILVTGPNDTEHLKTLSLVLSRLEAAGLRVHKSKCEFLSPSVSYLGHVIDEQGLHPMQEKVNAVQDAPNPRNVSELKSYLGLLTYYSKFLPNMSTVLSPLYKLLRNDTEWRWTKTELNAFQASKDLLTSSNLLVHFNPDLPLLLMCDASSYGVGAVLAHRMPDGSERPIGYTSRSLTSSQRNYSQLEREALALVFGVQHFHSYLFGHHFELVTDHQPLLALLHEHRPTSSQASARVRRWSLLLSAYEYSITFRRTQAHQNADALSRLPLPETQKESPTPPELVLLTEHLEDSPVTASHIRIWTRRDPVLSKVQQYVERGWPSRCDPSLAVYSSKRNELSIHQGCIMWGSRVVVPSRGRKAVLQELHEGHPGMTRMKSLSRMYVWWPNLEKDIENSVQACSQCQEQQPAPSLAPLHPWKWPSRPWSRIHMDFAGPFQGKMILVVIDSHSKWIEAFPTNSSTSQTVIQHSRTLFAQFGVPEILVTDNGSCFVSQEFETFLLKNGVKHITSAPFHPASNGLAERAVQIVKKGLKKESNGDMTSRLAKILMAYRTTPQSTTGETPSQLLQGRRIRTRLDLIKPSVGERVEGCQWQQKMNHDPAVRQKTFSKGDMVYFRNFGTGQRWWPGVVQEQTGPLSFLIKLPNDQLVRRHQDHLRRRNADEAEVSPQDVPVPASEELEPEVDTDDTSDLAPAVPDNGQGDSQDSTPEEADTSRDRSIPSSVEQPESRSPTVPSIDPPTEPIDRRPSGIPPVTKTYPKRNRKTPNWYRDAK